MARKTVSVPDEVAAVLREATIDGGTVLKLPPKQLDRALYDAVNKVLSAMGGKWNRKAGGHVFPFDPAPLLDEAMGTGQAVNRKQTLQFFETPAAVAEMMADRLGIQPGERVLEPSAGHGRLVKAAERRGGSVTAVEIDAANATILRGVGALVHLGDFLTFAQAEHIEYDAVIMNPPFSGNQDVRHIRAAWSLLGPHGRLAAIVSEHAINGGERECVDFRMWVAGNCGSLEKLPAGTFEAGGTKVGAWLLIMCKGVLEQQAAA